MNRRNSSSAEAELAEFMQNAFAEREAWLGHGASAPMVDLLRELARTFREEGDARVWLERPVDLLGGEKPIDAIRRGEVARVHGVLLALNAGVTT